MTTLKSVEKSLLGRLIPIGGGGQGTVYRAPGFVPTAGGVRLPVVFKEYTKPFQKQLDAGALADLVDLRDGMPAADRKRLVGRTAFPLHRVVDGGSICGFTMIEVPGRFFHEMTFLRGPERTLGEVQHLLQTDPILGDRGLPVDDRLRLGFLLDVAETLELFHKRGLVVGDFSAKNLLFRLDRPGCFFLDCDAMVVRGRSALPQAETPGWEVQAGEKTGTLASDLYKLALLAIRLFAGDQIERNPARAPQLPSSLRRLATAGVSAAPSSRPDAARWCEGIGKALVNAPKTARRAPATPSVPRVPFVPTPTRISPPTPTAPPPVPPPAPRPVVPAGPPTVPVVAPSPAPRGGGLGKAVAVVAICGALVATVVVLISATTGHQTSTTGTSSSAGNTVPVKHEEVLAIDRLLTASAKSRSAVIRAVDQVDGCTKVGTGVSGLTKVVGQRKKEVAMAQKLSAAAIPGGDDLLTSLRNFLDESLASDRDFLSWARGVQEDGCAGSAAHDGDYRDALAKSDLAGDDKDDFITRWNPVASGEALSPRTADEI